MPGDCTIEASFKHIAPRTHLAFDLDFSSCIHRSRWLKPPLAKGPGRYFVPHATVAARARCPCLIRPTRYVYHQNHAFVAHPREVSCTLCCSRQWIFNQGTSFTLHASQDVFMHLSKLSVLRTRPQGITRSCHIPISSRVIFGIYNTS